ncbi:CMD domain protein/alkylhydroperoxidase domain protein [Leucobacter komagatae]|uniref:CMD domain protein/alkylhydroperoxidase domain protein n=1 Tax=Leucobacter komagatae TaxID=55969 RepID=A0A542Y8G8_9MICO|nr:alkylhydroperoxidase domain protein [Leucobacter komagatae]TQL44371.1 CMD domain protein/alkylhydroperoxidase domain protein [Leucobacter komagatae]
MTTALTADIIDLLSGLTPGDELARLRDLRAQARENAQLSFVALLEPENPGQFSLAERYAVALFVAQLHGFADAEAFYADVLGDEAPALVDLLTGPDGLAAHAAASGPSGSYREPGLHEESTAARAWTPDEADTAALGERLAAALAHAHLLVIRPREASPAALGALVDAGWSADDIVSLSQLIAFLTFQLRAAWGLRAVAGSAPGGAAAPADPALPVVASGESSAGQVSVAASALITEYPDLSRPEAFTQQGLGWVPWLAPVAEADLAADQLDALVDPARAKMPYFRLLARDPAALRARTLTDLDIFFNVTGGVGRAERELAATAASRHNGCVFCASVHSAAATRESGRRDDVQRLLDEGVGADLGSDSWNAIVSASVALTNTPLSFGETDVRGLRDAGLGDAEIIDVVNGAAFFNWANRLMLSLGEPELPAKRVEQ